MFMVDGSPVLSSWDGSPVFIQEISLDTLCWRSDVTLRGLRASYQPLRPVSGVIHEPQSVMSDLQAMFMVAPCYNLFIELSHYRFFSDQHLLHGATTNLTPAIDYHDVVYKKNTQDMLTTVFSIIFALLWTSPKNRINKN